MFSRTAAGLASLAAATALAGAAHAHPKLLTTNPPANGVGAASASEIRIGFNEQVFPKLSGVVVTDASGRVIPTGASKNAPKDKKVLVVPLKGKLSPGPYQVAWHAVSVDTHRVEGKYGFTVQ